MKRETKKKINRQKLVDAAFELMSTQGIQETSVKAVSEAAGISFVTMYKYFPTKDDLVMAVVQRLFEKHMTAMMGLAKDQSLSFQERLHAFLRYAANLRDEFSSHVGHEFFEFSHRHPELRTQVNQWQDEFWQLIIADGRRSGLVRGEISDQAARLFIQMMEAQAIAEGPLSETMMVQLEDLCLYGLAGKEHGAQ